MYVCNSQTLKLDLRLNWSFSSGGGSNSWKEQAVALLVDCEVLFLKH